MSFKRLVKRISSKTNCESMQIFFLNAIISAGTEFYRIIKGKQLFESMNFFKSEPFFFKLKLS